MDLAHEAGGEARLVILGLGASASCFVRKARSYFSHITGTVRTSEKAEHLSKELAIDVVGFDGVSASPCLGSRLARATHLLSSVPPDGQSDPALQFVCANAKDLIELRWLGYLSSISVYGDQDGAWVDETVQPQPISERGRHRLKAEDGWRDLAERLGIPLQIFRLSGIYGPHSNQIEAVRNGTARPVVKPGQVFNRIHVEDIAGAVFAALQRPHIGPIVNVSDDEPAPPQDITSYAARLLGVSPPPVVPFSEADLRKTRRSFYQGNRRISNRRLRDAIGYELRYPTYREGLAACLKVDRPSYDLSRG